MEQLNSWPIEQRKDLLRGYERKLTWKDGDSVYVSNKDELHQSSYQ